MSWRHKFKLLENEQQEYEKSIRTQYEKEKEALVLELKILRQTHTEKVQSMSSSMLQLQKQVARLSHQLAANGITEESDDEMKEDNQEWLFNSLKEDAEFIKTAHSQAMHEYGMSTSHPLWMSIQKNAFDLRQELVNIQTLTSTQQLENQSPQRHNHENTFKMDDKTLSSGLKKVIFGKTHRSVKRKSAIFIS
ncbi:hypothetical protein BCR42DRAFT_411166 [Absidia repens]|uniref:Uncharacterized protein n=1 Tax=Absidia repens TaxID=90262 RepID=A0A1X2ILA2_9FUNG|nr:hypothetical protein BCR42DRAFT_411166 [Absidia repens]